MPDDKTTYTTTLALLRSATETRIRFFGRSAQSSRTVPTVRMLKTIFADGAMPPKADHVACFVQFDDFAHYDMRSVSYGRTAAQADRVGLIPDTYFFHSDGYAHTRQEASAGHLPQWQDRLDTVFWRGSPTYYWKKASGEPIQAIAEIPRVIMCQICASNPSCDVAIANEWGDRFPSGAVRNYCETGGFYRPGIPMTHHARYKFLIDVDGVANAWSLFDKLLMGSCVIKIVSRLEQWYYHRITPWEHYVPVQDDFRDLEEKIEWCLQHKTECAAIAANAQDFALNYGLDDACADAISEIDRCSVEIAEIDGP